MDSLVGMGTTNVCYKGNISSADTSGFLLFGTFDAHEYKSMAARAELGMRFGSPAGRDVLKLKLLKSQNHNNMDCRKWEC